MSSSYPSYSTTLLQCLETFSSALSVIGCSYTLFYIYRDKKHEILTNKFLVNLLWINLILSIFYGIGMSDESSEAGRRFCQFQALIVQWLE